MLHTDWIVCVCALLVLSQVPIHQVSLLEGKAKQKNESLRDFFFFLFFCLCVSQCVFWFLYKLYAWYFSTISITGTSVVASQLWYQSKSPWDRVVGHAL